MARLIDLTISIISSIPILLLLLLGGSSVVQSEENTVYLTIDVPQYGTGMYKAAYGVRYGCYQDVGGRMTGAQCVAECKKDPANCKRAKFIWSTGECCLSGEHDSPLVQIDSSTQTERSFRKFSIVIDVSALVPKDAVSSPPRLQQEQDQEVSIDDDASNLVNISLSREMPVSGEEDPVVLGPGLTAPECNRKCKQGKHTQCKAVNYDWVEGKCHLVSPAEYKQDWLEVKYRTIFMEPVVDAAAPPPPPPPQQPTTLTTAAQTPFRPPPRYP